MKKIVFVFVICLTLIISITATAFNLLNSNIKLGNKSITMEYPLFIRDNRVYVSIRNLCELLNIPIYWDEQEKEVCVDIYNKKTPVSSKTEYKEEGVIPDEETALAVGKIILEKYAERPMEYETEDKIYYLDTRYLEEENSWQIVQVFRFKDENVGGGIDGWADFANIKLNKNSGEIMYINTYSTFHN